MRKHALILTAALLAGCTNPTPTSPHTITVFGTAVAQVPPDKFSMTVAIESRHLNSDGALAQAEAKLAVAEKLLVKFKVPDTDYVLGGTRVQLEELDEAQIKAKKRREFEAYSNIEVTLFDARQRDDLIRELVRQHVGEVTELGSDLKDPIAHRNEARLAAVRQARLKARAMASELGQALGKASSIEENQPDFGPIHSNSNFFSQANDANVLASPRRGLGLVPVSASVKVSFLLD